MIYDNRDLIESGDYTLPTIGGDIVIIHNSNTLDRSNYPTKFILNTPMSDHDAAKALREFRENGVVPGSVTEFKQGGGL